MQIKNNSRIHIPVATHFAGFSCKHFNLDNIQDWNFRFHTKEPDGMKNMSRIFQSLIKKIIWMILYSLLTKFFDIPKFTITKKGIKVFRSIKYLMLWGILGINSTQFSANETIYESIFLLLWILEYKKSRAIESK